MTTQSAQDSSVMFNLRELMRIEDERVRDEQTARSAAQLQHAELERRAQEEARIADEAHRNALERARIEAEVAARAETERQVVLLRARLEVEAKAVAEQQAADRAHREAAPRTTPRTVRAQWLAYGLGLGLALSATAFGPAASTTTVTAPSSLATRAKLDPSAQRLDNQARELADLRQRLAMLLAHDAAPATATPPSPHTQVATPLRPSHTNRVPAASRPRAISAERQPAQNSPLDGLDDNDDPIGGLPEHARPRSFRDR